MRRILAALLLACIPAMAGAQSIAPGLRPSNSLGDLPIARSLNRDNRPNHNAGISPDSVNILSVGGYADAIRGAATVVGSGTAVYITPLRILNNMTVTVSTAGNTATITPSWLLPTITGQTNQLTTISVPGAGVSGANVYGYVTVSNPATGVVTCNSCSFAVGTYTGVAIGVAVLGSSQQGGNLALEGEDYGAHTITTVTDSSGFAYATQITIADAMMPAVNSTMTQIGNYVCVATVSWTDPTTWCGQVTNNSLTDGKTVTVTGLPGFGAAMPNPPTAGAYSAVAWGPFLFRPNDATACNGTGRYLQLPLAGSGINGTTQLANALVSTIASVDDVFHATLTTAATNATQYQTNYPSLLVGGSFGTGHTIQISVTSANYNGGSPVLVSYTTTSSDTTAALLATDIVAALNANPLFANGGYTAANAGSQYISFAFPAALGTVTITGTSTGSETFTYGAPTYTGGIPLMLTSGCDDWPAYQRAVTRIYERQDNFTNPSQVYFPRSSFMATPTLSGNNQYVAQVTQCGEGTVFWAEYTVTFSHGAYTCAPAGRPAPLDISDIVPAVSLKHLLSLPTGSVANIVVVGNSPLEPGTNNAGFASARLTILCKRFQRAFPLLKVNCIDRSVGGQQADMLNPYGYTNGFTNLNRNGGAGMPWWYSDFTQPWISYVRSARPDVIIFGFSDQESTSFTLASILQIIAYTQNSAWLTATGTNPDFGFFPFPYQPTGFSSQQGTNFAAALQRSFVKSCNSTNTLMANGECPFLVDMNRAQSILTDGYDPESQPMMRIANAPVYGGSSIAQFPYVFQTPYPGMTIAPHVRWTNASATQGSAVGGLLTATGGELDFTVGASAMSTAGNAPLAFNFNLTANATATTTLTVGYIGYAMQVGGTVSYGGVTGGRITAISLGCASGITTCAATLTLSAAVTYTTGNTLVYNQPAPAAPTVGYPGQVFRVYKDATSAVTPSAISCTSGIVTVTTTQAAGPTSGSAASFAAGSTIVVAGMTPSGYNGTYTVINNPTSTTATYPVASCPGAETVMGTISGNGNFAYRYDTVYFKTGQANCSGTSGNAYITCTVPQIGSWHQGLSISVPGAGTSPCPDFTGSTCFVGQITTQTVNSSNVQTINFASGTIGTTVTNVQPTIFRNSVPYTISARTAETVAEVASSCKIASGTYVELVPMIEYRGSQLTVSMCDETGPGPSILFNGPVERFDGPFQFTLDSPNHLALGVNVALNYSVQSTAAYACFPTTCTYAGGLGGYYAEDWNYPRVTAQLRVAGDIYAFCGNAVYGQVLGTLFGGQCAAHQSTNGAYALDDAVWSGLRLQ